MTGGALALSGLTVERLLGSGAFADVYLYRQELPRRLVAVKIMREPVTGEPARQAFEQEANLLAAVSTHPSIVTIHHAAIADTGRPYLIMEYCSRPGLAEQVRQRPLAVPEVLQTAIRLAGAVETAHRAGILHRDLKPANVLTTDYGWPALGDFGISSLAGHATTGGGAMSLPWAAPEVVAGHPSQRASDVYALAATAYTLLAGASPFERGGPAEVPALMARILSEPVPDIPRGDVPATLQRLLQFAMAKDPAQRPQSASEFARGLQRIEQDLNLPTTHLDIPRSEHEARDDDAEATRLASRPAAIEDRTRLTRRSHTEPEDRTSVVHRPAPDERTTVVRREPAAAEDRTTIVHRGAPEERTTVVPRDAPDDRTLLRGSAPQTPTAPTAPAPQTSRAAYDPGAEGAQAVAYGIRQTPAAPVVHRQAPQPFAAPPPAAPGRARPRRLGLRLILLAVGTVLLLAATVAGIIVLTTTG